VLAETRYEIDRSSEDYSKLLGYVRSLLPHESLQLAGKASKDGFEILTDAACQTI